MESAKEIEESDDLKKGYGKAEEAVNMAKEVSDKADEIAFAIDELKDGVESYEEIVKEMNLISRLASDVSMSVIEKAAEEVEVSSSELVVLTQEEMGIKELLAKKIQKINDVIKILDKKEGEQSEAESDQESGEFGDGGSEEQVDIGSSTVKVGIGTSTLLSASSTASGTVASILTPEQLAQRVEEIKSRIEQGTITLKEAVTGLRQLDESANTILENSTAQTNETQVPSEEEAGDANNQDDGQQQSEQVDQQTEGQTVAPESEPEQSAEINSEKDEQL